MEIETLQRFLLISAIVLFLFVFWKWLKKFLRRKDIVEPFPYLFPFKGESLSGNEILKFDMPYGAEVKAEVFDLKGVRLFTAFDQRIERGVHQMAFDLSSLPTGQYELKVTFPNQKVTRLFKVS
jgi:hypothetical protein